MIVKNTLDIEEAIHELEIVFNTSDVIAFFCVTVSMRPVGDDFIHLFSTIIELDKGMSNEERIKLGRAIIDLGKRIHKQATNRDVDQSE